MYISFFAAQRNEAR